MDKYGDNIINISEDYFDRDPSFSPDGKKIVVSSADGIVYMNSNGTNRVNLTNNLFDSFPEWSPGGEKIVYSEGINYGITIIDLYKNKQTFTNPINGNMHTNPFWIAYNKIIFGSIFPEGIYSINSNGSNLEQIFASSEIIHTFPEVSYSSILNKLLFTCEGGNYNRDVCVSNLDGTNIINLTDKPSNDYDASFSPNGKEIIFVSDRDGSEQIYKMILK